MRRRTDDAPDWPVRGIRRLVVLGLASGALLQLALETPAGWLQALARSASQDQVALDAPAGGLGSGSAGIFWQRPGHPVASLGRWQWEFGWVDGGPGWRLTGRDGPLRGSLGVRPGLRSVTLTDLHLSLPAEAIPSGMATWDLLHASGVVRVDVPSLRLAPPGPTGTGTLALRQASSPLVALPTLGSWQARWELQDGKGALTLATEQGPLHLEGQGHLALAGQSTLHGRAWTEPGSASVLEPILRLIGRQGPDGSIPLEFP